MLCTRQTFLLIALAACGFTASLPANAQLPFTATYTGSLTAVGFNPGPPAITEVAGMGSGPATFNLNTVTLDLFAQFGTTPSTAFGNVVHTAPNGDKLFGQTPDETIQLGAPGDPNFTFKGSEIITGGTGLFAGATGNIPFSGFGAFTSSTTNTFTYTNTGFIKLVPEPGTIALLSSLGVSGSLIAVFRLRRRRK